MSNTDKEEIAFETGKIPEKSISQMMDSDIEKMKNESIRKLEKNQIDKQVRAEAGITEIPKEPESVPKELPSLLFVIGSKILKCEKFKLDDDEAKIMGRHMSIVLGSMSSKMYSVIIIIVVVVSKVVTCMDAIQKKLHPPDKQIEIQSNKTEMNLKNPNKNEGDWL